MKARHKFHAKPSKADGIHFDSKKEKEFYHKLKILQKAGEVVGFLRQVPIRFSSGTKYVMDFLVFYSNGTCKGYEIKGYETDSWKIKSKLIADEFPWLDLEVVF